MIEPSVKPEPAMQTDGLDVDEIVDMLIGQVMSPIQQVITVHTRSMLKVASRERSRLLKLEHAARIVCAAESESERKRAIVQLSDVLQSPR